MKPKRFVLPVDHLPTRMPLGSSVLLYMALDLYHAPGWMWGVTWTLMAVLWIGWALIVWQQETKPMAGYGEQKENAIQRSEACGGYQPTPKKP